jgi:predicted nucleotidyltransferase
MNFPPAIQQSVEKHPCPLAFATISGAHLYGFASPDSDWDLRGVHVLPFNAIAGLERLDETIEQAAVIDGIELDLVTHDAKKFFLLMLKPNGYVLEQLYSPLIVQTSSEHEELKQIGHGCITRWHERHYQGFALNQWQLFEKENPRRIKPLLYVYRVLLTGINLMRTGVIEANLVNLNQEFKLPFIGELVERKTSTAEKQTLNDADIQFHLAETQRLHGILAEAAAASTLPDQPSSRDQLNDLLIRLRRKYM